MKWLLKQIKNSRIFQIALILLLLSIILLRDNTYIYIVQRHPLWTGERFWNALKNNDLDLAKALSSQDQWERLEKWSSDHKSTHCRSRFLDEGNGSSSSRVQNGDWQYSKYIVCHTPDEGLYCFYVDDIYIGNRNGEWRVYDWGEVQENC